MTNHNKLLLALVFGSMSYSATAKVYSWRGEDGAMHYSQFPRELVEKNNAQSRESRNIKDLADVVDDLDDQNDSNLLDGLDDIVANASAVREKDKVLKRTAPEVILAAQATALEQQALLESAQPRKNSVENKVLTAEKSKSSKENPFLANIHKRLNKRTADSSRDIRANAVSSEPKETVAITQTVKTERVSAKVKPQNRFLAGIKSKLNGRPTVSPQPTEAIKEPAPEPIIVKETSEAVHSRNAFLAGIERKRNRRNVDATSIASATPAIDRRATQSTGEPPPAIASTKSEKQSMQNKFLAEINKKLFRARLASNGENLNEVDQMLSQNKTDKNKVIHTKAKPGKDLSRSADKIKNIERQAETKAADTKPELPRQSSSALMLSRLSSNHVGRLPVGTDQLDRQGIDSSNQFVNDINRAAEK